VGLIGKIERLGKQKPHVQSLTIALAIFAHAHRYWCCKLKISGDTPMKLRALTLLSGLLLAACETPPTDGDAGYDGAGSGYGSGAGAASNGPGSQGDLEQNAGDRVFFGYDSATLSSSAQATLQRQAEWLNEYPELKIVLEGHADERGTRAYNLALGERRANAAKSYLTSLGIDGSRLTVVSYGKERPAVLGSSEQAWAQNRRSVTVISY
jgi:peptidoglycan-associated lipoprotein